MQISSLHLKTSISSSITALVTAGLLAMAGIEAKAQSQLEVWNFAGGAFNPDTYSGVFRPPALFPNTGSDFGATIGGINNLTSGGLGSNGFGAYGGIYTFFSSNVQFSIQTNQILSGLQTIGVSIEMGSDEVIDASTLLLAFNVGNPAVQSSAYSFLALGPLDSPIGEVDLIRHTWTWDITNLGSSSAFNIYWTQQQHEFYSEVRLTQTVPEPTAFFLFIAGGAFILMLNRRRAA